MRDCQNLHIGKTKVIKMKKYLFITIYFISFIFLIGIAFQILINICHETPHPEDIIEITIDVTYHEDYYKMTVNNINVVRNFNFQNVEVIIGNPWISTKFQIFHLNNILNNYESNLTYIDKDESEGFTKGDFFTIKKEVWGLYPYFKIIIDSSAVSSRIYYNNSSIRTTIDIHCIDKGDDWKLKVNDIFYGHDIRNTSSFDNTYIAFRAANYSVVRYNLSEISYNNSSDEKIITYYDEDNSGGLSISDSFLFNKEDNNLVDRHFDRRIFNIEIDHWWVYIEFTFNVHDGD